MASENSPLLAYRLLGEEGIAFPANGAGGPGGTSARKLSTFLGVVVPTVLSMFSIVVFLRIGEWIGGSGLTGGAVGDGGIGMRLGKGPGRSGWMKGLGGRLPVAWFQLWRGAY